MCTYQLLVPLVHGQVAQGDGHGSHHLVHVGAQQLGQHRQALLLPDGGADVAGPLGGESEQDIERERHRERDG